MIKVKHLWIATLIYLILPIAIFICSWCNIVVSIISCTILVIAFKQIWDAIEDKEEVIVEQDRQTILYCIAGICVIFAWVFFSGIGSFTYQNSDFFVRNAIYRDLVNEKWPLIINLGNQSDAVRQTCGTDKVAIVYYLTFWIVPSFISKLLRLPELGSNIILLLWSYIGLVLTYTHLHKYFKKKSFWILFIFIMFSGLDVIPWLVYLIRNGHIENIIGAHLDRYADFGLEYSSNTTILYWVFHQGIPIWLITMAMVNTKNDKFNLVFVSLSFAYSPWATLGLIPIGLRSLYCKDFKKCINVSNISVGLMMILVFVGYYSLNKSTMQGVNGIIFNYTDNKAYAVTVLIMFIYLEVGMYFIVVKNKLKKKYMRIVFLELMLIPFYVMTVSNDFCMRVSMPALLILQLYILESIFEHRNSYVLTVLLLIGCITPFNEIFRSTFMTIYGHNEPNNVLYSYTNMRTDDPETLKLENEQIFAHNYKDKVYYTYIMKHNE